MIYKSCIGTQKYPTIHDMQCNGQMIGYCNSKDTFSLEINIDETCKSIMQHLKAGTWDGDTFQASWKFYNHAFLGCLKIHE